MSTTDDRRIFVAIASYRDPETGPTIGNMFSLADRPSLVSVGLCWQRSDGEDRMLLGPYPRGRVAVRAYHSSESRGAGWARSVAHAMRGSEPYVLQVDSHMRFHRGWDTSLLNMLAACGSDRPILSTYPATYEPPRSMGPCGSWSLRASRFNRQGMLSFAGTEVVAPFPVPHAWIAGGLIFAPSRFFDEVPYDPSVYFLGEEASLAARAWTSGWDSFAPNQCVVHHYYGRHEARRHWDDDAAWSDADRVSVGRVRKILGGPPATDPRSNDATDGPLGLGSKRTLSQFELYAGVSFSERWIRPR